MKKNLLVFSGALFLTSVTYAATVGKVDAKKGTLIVEDADDFNSGDKVCISDGSKQIACGDVLKKRGTKASVKLKSAALAAKVKSGMSVEKPGGVASTGEAGTATGKTAPKKKIPSMVTLGYIGGISPVAQNKVGYEGSATEKTFTLTNGGSNNLQLFGLTLGASMGSMSFGLRYRAYSELISTYNFNQLEGSEVYAEVDQKGTEIAPYFDYFFLTPAIGSTMYFKAGAGIDFAMSEVSVAITEKSDDDSIAETAVVSATSKTNVISLRLPVEMDFVFKPMTINVGLVVYVPLVAMGSTFTPDFNGYEATDDEKADAEAALGHKKGSFGADFSLAAGVAF